MYTTVPVMDMTNSHGGFYVYVLVACILCSLILWLVEPVFENNHSGRKTRKLFHCFFIGLFLIMGIITFKNSYKEELPPVNQKVTATFKRYIVQSEGKHNSPAHFAEFIVPEGTVLIRVPTNVAISDKVILYRN